MKHIWEEEDIWAGRLFWRPHEINKCSEMGYTRTVIFKIGYCLNCRRDKETNRDYCIVSVLTDGCIYGHGSAKELAEQFTKEEYAPLSNKTLIEVLRKSEIERITG